MAKKAWETAVGERTGSQEDGDELLAQKKSDRDRARIARQEAEDEAAHQARMAKYNKETATSEAAVEKTGEKKEEGPGGFKLTGGMHIDLDAERKEAKEAAVRERSESKAEAERLRKEIADSATRTAQENNQLRNDLHAAEIREIKAAAAGGQGSLAQQLVEIKTLAAELGLKAPDPGISDPALQIQIIQLEHAEAARAREFEWQMQKDRDEREDRKEERLDNRAASSATLAQQAKRDEMFANAPKMIGTAFAQGLMTGGGAGEGVSEKPKGKAGYRIEVATGRAAELDCEECGEPIGIGPTQRGAVCASCGAKYVIKRVSGVAEPPSGEEEEEE